MTGSIVDACYRCLVYRKVNFPIAVLSGSFVSWNFRRPRVRVTEQLMIKRRQLRTVIFCFLSVSILLQEHKVGIYLIL